MQPPMSQSFFIGTLAHTPALGQLDILKDHLLIVDPQGYITHLDPLSSPVSQQILSDRDPTKTTLTTVPPNSFLLPTFTDLHLHAPQYLYAGTGLDQPLMQWLERYAFKAEQRIDADNELAKRVYDTLGRRLIEVGTGAALVFGTINTDTKSVSFHSSPPLLNGRLSVSPFHLPQSHPRPNVPQPRSARLHR